MLVLSVCVRVCVCVYGRLLVLYSDCSFTKLTLDLNVLYKQNKKIN